MNNKKMYKLIGLFTMLLLLLPFSTFVYFGLYSINNLHPETYQRYATEGKYEKNIFLSEEVDERTNVYDSINCVDFTEVKKDGRIQTVYKIINKNKNKIRESLINNEKYMNYLSDNELTVEDFFSYTEKMSALDDNFFKSGFLIGWLIIIYTCVEKFGWRRKFYFFAGLVYLFSVVSQFTGMQIDNLLYYTFLKSYSKYDDFIVTGPLLFEALTQSCLTFIIFDYLLQVYGSKRDVIINNFLVDLDIMVDQIESRTTTPTEIGITLNKNARKFLRVCSKEIWRYNINKKFNKIFAHMNYLDDELNSFIVIIKEETEDILRLRQTNINGYDKRIRNLRWKILFLKRKYY